MTKEKPKYRDSKHVVKRTSQESIILSCCGYREVNRERFTRLFQKVWSNIPRGDKLRMLRYWRSCPSIPPMPGTNAEVKRGLPAHGLILTSEPSPDIAERDTPGIAICIRCGHRVEFWEPYIEALPDEHAECLIAHELAHVLQWADGYEFGEDLQTELDADECIECFWGYDVDAYWSYIREHKGELPDVVKAYSEL
jgi:hypothetical protein